MRIRDLLTGWRRQPIAGGMVLSPPVEGIGKVKVTEGSPLRRMRDVVDELIAKVPPELQSSVQVGPLVRFPTHEGEHAGMLTLAIHMPRGPMERTLAMVVGDERYALIVGTVMAQEYFAQFREIVDLMTRSWFM